MKKAILLFLTALMTIGAMAQTDIQELQRKANAGDAEAMNTLGTCYKNGEGVTRNHKEAVYWWKKAAEQGHGWAMYNLGVCYKNGDGVGRNYEAALEWYKKAAGSSYLLSQFAANDIAQCYYYGHGVEQNYKQAYDILKGIAEEYLTGESMQLLAKCCRFGRGCTQDLEKADEWEKKAAKRGDDDAKEAIRLREMAR